MATVAEPWAIRRARAMTKASTISGRPVLVRLLDSTSPTPLATRMLPKTPPAPTTSRIMPTGLSALSATVTRCLALHPRRTPST